MSLMYHLKRSIIREELRALTGDGPSAALLDQFLRWYSIDYYWSHWTLAHKMTAARQGIAPHRLHHDVPSDHWIPLSTVDLAESLMMDADEADVERYIAHFMEKGWIYRDPDQQDIPRFRCDAVKIHGDLKKLGYTLDGFYDLSARNAHNADKAGRNAVRTGHTNL